MLVSQTDVPGSIPGLRIEKKNNFFIHHVSLYNVNKQ